MRAADEGGQVQPIANRCWQNNLFVRCDRGAGRAATARLNSWITARQDINNRIDNLIILSYYYK